MSKRYDRVTFNLDEMQRASLLPPTLEELMPGDHLMRVVNRIIDPLGLAPLLAQNKGGGTSSFHPKLMLKVLV